MAGRPPGEPAFVPVTGGPSCMELGERFAGRFFNQRLLALVLFLL